MNCELFRITFYWLEIWDEIVRIQRNIIFQIDFSIAINHAKLFATTFDDNVNKIRREKFIDVIVYCLLSISLYDVNLIDNDQLFNCSNTALFVAFVILILIECSLILLNVNFLSSFEFWIVLHLCDFAIVQKILNSKRRNSLFSNDFSMIWMKIHFAKKFWQVAQIFSIVSIFWICRYCYK